MLPLRVALVQFAPQIARVSANIAKARSLTDNLLPRSLDLLCLPELIFTGYVFPSSSSISPHLELPQSGPTSLFCAELAARLNCYVFAGYPERLPPTDLPRTALDHDGHKVHIVGANSAVLYGPDGKYLGGYRKSNLFETDMTWAAPGTGFATFHLPPPLGTVCLGICMDLNVAPPAVWDYPHGPYELADHCLSQNANTLIMLNAWLDSGHDQEDDHDWHTINYWAARLRPLWAKPATTHSTGDLDDTQGTSTDGDGQDTVVRVVICNRSGNENGITFAGTSAAFSLKRGSGIPNLLHVMNRREEVVRVWNI